MMGGMVSRILWKDGALAGGALLTVAAFVLAWVFPVWPGDIGTLLAVQGWQTPALTDLLRAVSWLGRTPVAVALTALAVALLFLNRRRADALLLALAVLPTALVPALKPLIGRPRPDYALIDPAPGTLAFPSGHATFALLLGGILIYLAGQRLRNPWLRHGLRGGLALLILLVGVSRVYLGVHWPSDVIGGYLYGAVALAAIIRLWDTRASSFQPGDAERAEL